MVMYAGRQAEVATTDEIFYRTRHPYTLGLLASLPRIDDTGDEPLLPIPGAPPSLINKPSGCAFHPRCPFAIVPGICSDEVPELRPSGTSMHLAACHRAEHVAEVGVEAMRRAAGEEELVPDEELIPDFAVEEP
jgi:oligopeptide/dipeptide ABC transporter ATP-binding protein